MRAFLAPRLSQRRLPPLHATRFGTVTMALSVLFGAGALGVSLGGALRPAASHTYLISTIGSTTLCTIAVPSSLSAAPTEAHSGHSTDTATITRPAGTDNVKSVVVKQYWT